MLITVTIGGSRLNMSERGYERLKARMRQLTDSVPESMRQMVQDDAESRLADYFARRISVAEVLTDADVDAAFADLGLGASAKTESEENRAGGTTRDEAKGPETAPDGASQGPVPHDAQSGSGPWRRDTSDKIVAGVCSGIARKAGCDPIWIRLAFVCFTVCAWQAWVAVAYLILWLVLPADGTKTGGSDPDIRFESGGRRSGCLSVALTVLLCLVALAAVVLGLCVAPFFLMNLILG